MSDSQEEMRGRILKLYRAATKDRRSINQKELSDLSGQTQSTVSRLLSGATPLKIEHVNAISIGLSKCTFKDGSGTSAVLADYLYKYILNGSDPNGRFVTPAVQSLVSRLNLSENKVFEGAKSPLFEEIPVIHFPAAISFENENKLWTFHEDHSGGTNKIRIVFRATPERIMSSEDVTNLKNTVLNDNELSEIDRKRIFDEINRITEKSNPYLRLRSLELEDLDKKAGTSILTLRCDPSDYHVGALAATIKRIGSSADKIKKKLNDKNVHSLAIRIAIVSVSARSMQRGGKPYVDNARSIILHRRTSKVFTYRRAWDVSAAGYIDRQDHTSEHDERRIDISKAARAEINQELGVPTWLLPTEEHFEFFGLTQNIETGQTDVVGQVHVDSDRFEQIWNSRKHNEDEVEEVARVSLTPEGVARFLSQEDFRMVPSALTTILLCLRHAGFSNADIISELRLVVDEVRLRNGFAAYDNK